MFSLYSGSSERIEKKKRRGIIYTHTRSIALISSIALTENRIVALLNIFFVDSMRPRMHIEFDKNMCVISLTACTNFVHFIFRSLFSFYFHFSDHNNLIMNSGVSRSCCKPDAYFSLNFFVVVKF